MLAKRGSRSAEEEVTETVQTLFDQCPEIETDERERTSNQKTTEVLF